MQCFESFFHTSLVIIVVDIFVFRSVLMVGMRCGSFKLWDTMLNT